MIGFTPVPSNHDLTLDAAQLLLGPEASFPSEGQLENLPWHRQRAIAKKQLPKMKNMEGKETLLPLEEMWRERWWVKGVVGRGGYGEIYLARDTLNAEEVAIKTEKRLRRGKTSKRMILEQRALLRLQGRPHVPKMIASGHDGKINFLIMELLSLNVGDLKKQSPAKRLSRTTTARIMQQAVAGLRDVHQINYLHRDVKPANMCFGVTVRTRHVLMMVDFGLVRRFKQSDGSLRPLRPLPGFRGTLRYVSIRVHDKLEQGPADDLVSLVYSGIELLVGELPWKYMNEGNDVRQAKQELEGCDPRSFLRLTTPSFQDFARAIFSLQTEDEPHYARLQSLINDMVGGRSMSDPYDWENNYAEVYETGTDGLHF